MALDRSVNNQKYAHGSDNSAKQNKSGIPTFDSVTAVTPAGKQRTQTISLMGSP